MALNEFEAALVGRFERMLIDDRAPDGRPLTDLQRQIVRELRWLIFDLARHRDRERVR